MFVSVIKRNPVCLEILHIYRFRCPRDRPVPVEEDGIPNRWKMQLNQLEKKMGWKKASKAFNVPKTTLMRLAQERYGSPKAAARTKMGRPTVLGVQLEKKLVEYCLVMEKVFFF